MPGLAWAIMRMNFSRAFGWAGYFCMAKASSVTSASMRSVFSAAPAGTGLPGRRLAGDARRGAAAAGGAALAGVTVGTTAAALASGGDGATAAAGASEGKAAKSR